MKKRLLSVALVVVMAVCLVGCGTTYQEATGQAEKTREESIAGGYFTVITSWGNTNYYIVYAKDTKSEIFCNVDRLSIWHYPTLQRRRNIAGL